MNIEYTTVESFPRWGCPCCETKPEEKFETLDIDTITLEPEVRTTRLYSSFWTIRCPSCGGISYLVELDVLSDRNPATEFVAGNCWQAEERSKFILKSAKLSWEYEHEKGIEFDDGRKAKWIGRHFLGLFDDFNEAKMRANKIAMIALAWRCPS
ncbi:hypothetical protein ACFSSA_13495 [Luteolibacter algae]|uniref:Uncharacterized protein n=1 Tax=Luteolibacter algae TaxID=454151 RepID=A0ABW5D9D6_9BACT